MNLASFLAASTAERPVATGPPSEEICESLKNVYFFMPQMIKLLVIKKEGFFPQTNC
jgi:hypothetical protein